MKMREKSLEKRLVRPIGIGDSIPSVREALSHGVDVRCALWGQQLRGKVGSSLRQGLHGSLLRTPRAFEELTIYYCQLTIIGCTPSKLGG